jgi:hypothetical protein
MALMLAEQEDGPLSENEAGLFSFSWRIKRDAHSYHRIAVIRFIGKVRWPKNRYKNTTL